MSEVISIEEFKAKKQPPQEKDDGETLVDALEIVLDTIESTADYGFVLLSKGGYVTSGATIEDLDLLIHLLKETIIEMKEKDYE